MKVKLFLPIIAILCTLSQATSSKAASFSGSRLMTNPLIRVCTINGGIFETYPSGTDTVALCRFGALLVDSQSLVSNLNGISTEAAGAILSGTQADTCALVGAINLKPTGLAEYLCVFGDDSKLNLSILRNQPDLPDRIRLKEILLAR